jgi:hypothetical protein
MNHEERLKKAFDFSADLTKQLIALATGIIALTITFSHEFLQAPQAAHRGFAMWGWYLLLASVVFGIMTLSALTGNLDAADKTKPLTIYAPNVVACSVMQFATFGGGLLMTILFAAGSR